MTHSNETVPPGYLGPIIFIGMAESYNYERIIACDNNGANCGSRWANNKTKKINNDKRSGKNYYYGLKTKDVPSRSVE